MSPRVEVCTQEEANRIISKLGSDPKLWAEQLLHGHVDAVCRNLDGSVAWEIHQPNLITDVGRRAFMTYGLGSTCMFSSPSAEAAALGRYALHDNGNANSSQISTAVTPVYSSVTLTKTWTYTWSTPPTDNRQIGTVGLCVNTSLTYGANYIAAYTVLSPVKTQSTVQTLEVIYKITMTPIY